MPRSEGEQDLNVDNHSARRVTRADVARVAGTSVAVVSYVINNGPRPVAEATRLRVLAAIEQTGYRPNDIARALASGSTQTYGLVVPDISNPFFATGRCSRKPSAAAACCCWATPATIVSASMSLSTTCCAAVDGLLYTSVDRHPWFDLIRASGTPCVIDTIDSGPASVPFASTSATPPASNPPSAATRLSRHRHFYRPADHAQRAGSPERLARCAAGGGHCATRRVDFRSTLHPPGRLRATQRTVQGPRPRAVFTSNEQQALGCLSALAEHGLRAPDDLALICFNGTQQSEFSVPPLSAVEQPIDAMAKRAIAMMPPVPRPPSCMNSLFNCASAIPAAVSGFQDTLYAFNH